MVWSLIFIGIPLTDESKALSPSPGVDSPVVKAEAYKMELELSGRIKYADTREEQEYLAAIGGVDAVLIERGKVLVSSSLKKNPLAVVCGVAREEVLAALRIKAAENSAAYAGISGIVLSEIKDPYLAFFNDPDEMAMPDEKLVDSILARALVLIMIIKEKMIGEQDLTRQERAFLELIGPLIASEEEDFFTAIFWDAGLREIKIRAAMANGTKFSRSGGAFLRPPARGVPVNAEYWFYTRDENGELLREPSGFPGEWFVNADPGDGILKELELAAIHRVVKSFALSAVSAGKSGFSKGKFFIVGELPRGSGPDDFVICPSEEYGLEIWVSEEFLDYGIAKQRRLFTEAIRNCPFEGKPVKKRKNLDHVPGGVSKIAVINDIKAIHDTDLGRISAVYPSSILMASYMISKGMPARIVDVYSYGEAEIPSLRQQLKGVDIVCLSVYDKALLNVKQLIRYIKKINPAIKIAVGGPTATISPEHAAAFLGAGANVIYRGDMESGSFESIVNFLEKGDPEFFIKYGAVPQADAGGYSFHFGNAHYFRDLLHVNRITEEQLNQRKFDYTFFTPPRLGSFFAFMTSIGCPYNCGFCSTGSGKHVRAMTPEKVLSILTSYNEWLKELSAKGVVIPRESYKVHFRDDNFFFDKERALKILGMIRGSGMPLEVVALQIRIDTFLKTASPGQSPEVDTDFIRRLSEQADVFENGQVSIIAGTDALLDKELDRLGKGGLYRESEITKIVMELEKYKIRNFHYMILTTPESGIADFMKTICRAYSLTRENEHACFDLTDMWNLGIIPHTTTRVANELVMRDHKDLGRISTRRTPYPEYDIIGGGTAAIYSSEIPPRVLFGIDAFLSFSGISAGNVDDIWWMVGATLKSLQDSLEGVRSIEELRKYEPLLGQDVEDEFARFLGNALYSIDPADMQKLLFLSDLQYQYIVTKSRVKLLREEIERSLSRKLDTFSSAAEELMAEPAKDVSGCSVILYADEIVKKGLIVDMDSATRAVLAERNVLSGGLIVLYAKEEASGLMLKEIFKKAAPDVEILVVSPRDIMNEQDEVGEANRLINYSRAKGAGEILALIKGPTSQPEALAGLAKRSSLPVIVVGQEEGIYSFARALAMALSVRASEGSRGWLIMMPPVRSAGEAVRQKYEEYQRELAALAAA